MSVLYFKIFNIKLQSQRLFRFSKPKIMLFMILLIILTQFILIYFILLFYNDSYFYYKLCLHRQLLILYLFIYLDFSIVLKYLPTMPEVVGSNPVQSMDVNLRFLSDIKWSLTISFPTSGVWIYISIVSIN